MDSLDMKKVYGYLLGLFVVGVVSAQTNAEVVGDKIYGGVVSLFENSAGAGNISVVLFGILLWMVLYSIFKSMNLFQRNQWWSGGAALIVTLLAFIYLPSDFVNAIGQGYGALGATVLTVMPFAIAIYFTVWVTSSLLVARAIWIVFALYYLVLFAYALIGPWLDAPAGTSFSTVFNGTAPWFYIVAFIASFILYLFIAPFRKRIWEEELKSMEEKIYGNTKKFGLGLKAAGAVADEAASP